MKSRFITVLSTLLLFSGCLTTEGFMRRVHKNRHHAIEEMAKLLPSENNCMIVQMVEKPFPLTIIIRKNTLDSISKSDAVAILDRFHACDDVIVFTGYTTTEIISGHECYLHPEQYIILKQAKDLSKLELNRE